MFLYSTRCCTGKLDRNVESRTNTCAKNFARVDDAFMPKHVRYHVDTCTAKH